MAEIIIVSNRLPVSVAKQDGKLTFSESIGGLATGLSSYTKNQKTPWIGWPGIASDQLTEVDKQTIVEELAKSNCRPVFLTQKQLDDFYSGYSNEVLWPLFHNLPFKIKSQHDKWWRAYREVNRRFADEVLSVARPGSRIWIHDYQLLLLPELLRAEQPKADIGLFLHIPFPDVKRFTRLGEHKKLLHGMLGANLVGFHTRSYVEDFLDNCQEADLSVTAENQVITGERLVQVADFPMSIDYDKYASASRSKAVKASAKAYRKRYKGRKVIVGIDRLDPSKGLEQRLEAYRELLEQQPRWREKVVFSMVAAPSRTSIATYRNLAQRLDKLVTSINETYGTPGWKPVDYMNVSQPFEVVTALFSLADVAFITPLRDGMNLAAKEFVAANRKRGVLILSETAGAAAELQDAIIVNPRQTTSLVAALEQALSMRRRELRTRLRHMQQYLAAHTVQDWAKSFVDSLQQPVPGTRPLTRSLGGRSEQALREDFMSARKRLLLLDYDGSLIPYKENYAAAKPPQHLLNLLKKLSESSDVVLISGRQATELDSWFGALPIDLIAEHGTQFKTAGRGTWQTLANSETRWMRQVQPILEKYTALTPGARIEAKPHSLVWHYRASPPYYAQKYIVIIKRVLRPLLKVYGIQLFQGNKILEIKDPRINKGAAVGRWLKRRYDFILAIGDDFTDEELFRQLPFSAYSIKVGRGTTHARFRLHSPTDVRALLKKLS